MHTMIVLVLIGPTANLALAPKFERIMPVAHAEEEVVVELLLKAIVVALKDLLRSLLVLIQHVAMVLLL